MSVSLEISQSIVTVQVVAYLLLFKFCVFGTHIAWYSPLFRVESSNPDTIPRACDGCCVASFWYLRHHLGIHNCLECVGKV